MGSFVHANSLKKRGTKVRAMLALEMIGYFKDDPGSQSYPLFLLRPFYPSAGDFIAVVGKLFQHKLVKSVREAMRNATPLPVESLNAPRLLPGVALSDHLNYWRWASRPLWSRIRLSIEIPITIQLLIRPIHWIIHVWHRW